QGEPVPTPREDDAFQPALAWVAQVRLVVEDVVHAVHEQVVGDEEPEGPDHQGGGDTASGEEVCGGEGIRRVHPAHGPGRADDLTHCAAQVGCGAEDSGAHASSLRGAWSSRSAGRRSPAASGQAKSSTGARHSRTPMSDVSSNRKRSARIMRLSKTTVRTSSTTIVTPVVSHH